MHPVAAALTHETRERAEPGIAYAIARLERALRAEIARRVAPYGLTTLQYTALSVLHRHGAPLSNAQLARRAYMRPQSMSEVIDVLEQRGLIRRNPHPKHRRQLPARLTPRGRRVLAACDVAVSELEDTMLAGLSDADRRRFLANVMAAVRALRAGFPLGGEADASAATEDRANGPRLERNGRQRSARRTEVAERS
jgi:DNA-binding MarR family transcriptional regulator